MTKTTNEPVEDTFHSITPGGYTYFTVQSRITHQTPYGNPDGELVPELDVDSWGDISWDAYGTIAEPWAGKGNDWKPVFRTAHNETYSVWSATGRRGWWTLHYAALAFVRMCEADKNDKCNWHTFEGKLRTRLRREYRIVQVTVSKRVEALTIGDVALALVSPPPSKDPE